MSTVGVPASTICSSAFFTQQLPGEASPKLRLSCGGTCVCSGVTCFSKLSTEGQSSWGVCSTAHVLSPSVTGHF